MVSMTIEITKSEIRFTVQQQPTGKTLFARVVQVVEGTSWQSVANGFELGARAVLAQAAKGLEGVDWP